MKVILTIGNPCSGYQAVARMLTQSGVASAQAGSKANLSPQVLQAQLLRSHEVDLSGTVPLAQVQPGKLWNELATDLFLTNMQQPNWGWADAQSIVLMDFWHDFDSQVRLLLVYNSPANYLAQVLSGSTQPTAQTVNTALDDWARWNTALLRYVHRHPDYCLLVNAQQAAEQPQSLLGAVTSHWQISGLQAAAANPVSQPDYQHLQAHLINQLIDTLHPAWALHQELEGAALLAGEPDTNSKADDAPSASQAWADWSRMRAILAHFADSTTQLDALAKDKAELTAARDAESKAKAQAIAETAKAKADAAEVRKENELLLLQLHQVQEELEAHFLKIQTLAPLAGQVDQLKNDLNGIQSERDTLLKEKADLLKTRDDQAKLLQERQKQLETNQKAHEAAHKVHEQTSKLLKELQTSMAGLQTQKEQLNKEKSALTHARDALLAEKGQLAQQLAEQKAQLDQTVQSSKSNLEATELKQENELLLLQLHQVQEELEHYFLRYQELENTQKTKAASFVTDFWPMHQPQELVIDMQQDIVGSNWYPAESDGRWAGPAKLSTLQMPPVQPGNYTLELDIVDAMNLSIVNGLMVEALGQTLPVEVIYPLYQGEYPLICKVALNVSQDAAQQAWQVNLRFANTVSPAETGSDDMRHLAVRLRSLKLVKQS